MGSRRRGSASSTLPAKKKMEIHLALLLLLGTGVLGQEEDAAAQPECNKDCEESWKYVEFLKEDINGNITEILTNFKTTQDGDKAVTKTMEKVMEVRESILARIKGIRKEEVEICVGHNVKQEEKLSEFRMGIMEILLKLVDTDASSIDSLREVGDLLIAFRLKISTEVMRILMLPAPCSSRPPPNTKCPECDALEKLKKTLLKMLLEMPLKTKLTTELRSAWSPQCSRWSLSPPTGFLTPTLLFCTPKSLSQRMRQ